MSADRDINPGNLPQDVLRYFRQKGLKPGFSWQDVWREEHDAAFTAAKILRLDVLEALKDELDTAIAEGLPYAQFVKEVKPRLVKLGWWDTHEVRDPETGKLARVVPPKRLALIYETNMRTARAVGQWERIERGAKLRPYLLYQVGPSKKHREQHLAWHGLLLPVDDDFWSYAMPPNGWGCACHTRSVSKTEYRDLTKRGVIAGVPEPILDDEGLPTGHVRQAKVEVQTKAPKVPLVPWTNKRTGETHLVREGIDPGFDKRPGEGRRDVMREQKARLAEAKKPAGKRKR